MGLIGSDQLAPLLACPVCRSPIQETGNRYVCSRSECRFGGGRAFPTAGGQPVFIDFDHSIAFEDEVVGSGGSSLITRGKSIPLKRRMLETILPSNLVAAKNAERLKAMLKAKTERPTLLLIGGGSPGEGTETLYEDSAIDLIGFDLYASSLTNFIADAHAIPILEVSVDAVWIQAVLEHVLDPWAVVLEIHRVLKPGGLVYAETPFMQQVHEGPYDFTRFTESGHRWLFRKFELIDSGVALGPAAQILWSIDYLVRGLTRSVKAGILAKLLFSWLQYLDRLVDRRQAVDGASAVFFLGRKSDSELRPRDMIAHYQGAHSRK